MEADVAVKLTLSLQVKPGHVLITPPLAFQISHYSFLETHVPT